MKELRIAGLKELLQEPKRIAITNHVNPDGDAMGSALGLYAVLNKLGHDVSVIVPNDYPEFLKWMPGNNEVIVGQDQTDDANEKINSADIIFHLDYNAYSRAGELESVLRESAAIKVLIDHHRQPEQWPDFIFSDISMSSTSQMIYELLEMFEWLEYLDINSASCLYTGIITDTGSFRFSSTSAKTHKIAAHFMDLGVEPAKIYNQVFDNNSANRLKLLADLLQNMEYFPENGAALLYLTKENQQKNNYQKGDSEGFVNYGLSIGGVKFSVFFREENEMIKVSLRSKEDFDVNIIARTYFNGGGHLNAAGGRLNCSLKEALDLARNVINQQSPK